MGVAERYLYVALARHFRSVGNAGADVGLFDSRVFVQDFLAAHSAREQVENQRHPDPMPPNAGLSEAHLRVHRDAGKQLFSGHGDTVTVSLDPSLDSVLIPATGVFYSIAIGRVGLTHPTSASRYGLSAAPAWLRPRARNSSSKISPGWVGGRFMRRMSW